MDKCLLINIELCYSYIQKIEGCSKKTIARVIFKI